MSVKFRQTVDAYDAEIEEISCFVTAFPGESGLNKNRVECLIDTAADTHDTACIEINSPTKRPGGVKHQYHFYQKPLVGPIPLGANFTSFIVRNSGGLTIADLYIDGSTGEIRLYSEANTIHSAIINVGTTINAAVGTEKLIDLLISQNDYLKILVNGVQKVNMPLSGSVGNAVAASIRAGIDHVDGTTATGVKMQIRGLQIGDAPDAGALTDSSVNFRDLSANELDPDIQTARNVTPVVPVGAIWLTPALGMSGAMSANAGLGKSNAADGTLASMLYTGFGKFPANQEISAQLRVMPPAGRVIRFSYRVQETAGNNLYYVEIDVGSKTVKFFKKTGGGAPVQIGTTKVGLSFRLRDRIGVRVIGTEHYFIRQRGSAMPLHHVTDATISATGYFGVATDSSVVRLDNVAGGPYIP